MASLEALLSMMQDAAGPDSGPLWVRVDRHGGAYRPGGDGSPSLRLRIDQEPLLGWSAPPACVAVGMVSGGWARSMAEGAAPASWAVEADW